MKILLFTLLLILFGVPLNAQADGILGKWLISTGEAHMEVYKKNGKYEGKVVWLRDPIDTETNEPLKDKLNPDPKLKTRPVMGIIALKDLTYKNGEWVGGTIYQPRTGNTYQCKLWLEDKNHINLRGYWGLFYETRTWVRVN